MGPEGVWGERVAERASREGSEGRKGDRETKGERGSEERDGSLRMAGATAYEGAARAEGADTVVVVGSAAERRSRSSTGGW